MIHHLALFQLKPEVASSEVETMMRQTRSQLLKIDEVLAVQCGRAVDPTGEWGFFFSIDCESLDKLTICQENPIYLKYIEKVLKPHTSNSFRANFQTEPGRDLR
ncbi:MAG: Dabb family protein [Chthoniobacteraceae bacterium]|nr:Dabb family protein [Chthoniobacteraceae bacterium]